MEPRKSLTEPCTQIIARRQYQSTGINLIPECAGQKGVSSLSRSMILGSSSENISPSIGHSQVIEFSISVSFPLPHKL